MCNNNNKKADLRHKEKMLKKWKLMAVESFVL